MVQEHRYSELQDILPVIDWCVRSIIRREIQQEMEIVQLVWSRVMDVQEVLTWRNLITRYPKLHEVVSFLYLCCFSLLKLNGESFSVYREEVRLRYRALLRFLYYQKAG